MNKEIKKDFYVYVHKRLDTNEVFYVGKGKDKRAYSNYKRSEYWKRIVKKCGYEVAFIATNLDEKTAFDLEIKTILSLDKSKLCNMTNGGEGTSGWKHTDSAKQKVSEKNKGKTRTEQFKKRRSELAKQQWENPAYREKMEKLLKEREFSQEHRKALSEAQKGRKNFLGKRHTEETKKKQSESAKKRWAKNGTN